MTEAVNVPLLVALLGGLAAATTFHVVRLRANARGWPDAALTLTALTCLCVYVGGWRRFELLAVATAAVMLQVVLPARLAGRRTQPTDS